MAKYQVYVPERTGRRKMTAGQWLAEFRMYERGERSRVFDLPSPIRVTITADDEQTKQSKTCRTSTDLFSMFSLPGLITAVSWEDAKLGAHGLFELNQAYKTAAVRSGGLNIVRHWLENRQGPSTPLGCDFQALLSFLEIRPVFRGKTANRKKSTPTLSPKTRAL